MQKHSLIHFSSCVSDLKVHVLEGLTTVSNNRTNYTAFLNILQILTTDNPIFLIIRYISYS